MPVMKRPGEGIAVLSIRVQTTVAAGAFTFVEVNTRPVEVAAQAVPVSAALRAIAAMQQPVRVAP